jgi:hypothetical protein
MFGEILGAVAGGLLGGKDGGGSQTASKEPWAPVAPWLQSLIGQGQNLSAHYAANPFNAAQTAAYGNMANQSAFMRSLVPSLLGQISSQPLSFNRAQPEARPQAYNFSGLLGNGGNSSGLGLLSGGGVNPVSTMPANIQQAAPVMPQPAVAPPWSPIPGQPGFPGRDLWNMDYTGAGA